MPWKVLNAGHFGAPQSRERFILMGVKKGSALPEYPTPITNLACRPKLHPELSFRPSCLDAIGDLTDADTFETLNSNDAVNTTRFGDPSEYAAELRCLKNDAWHFGYVRQWQPSVLTSSARTEQLQP